MEAQRLPLLGVLWCQAIPSAFSASQSGFFCCFFFNFVVAHTLTGAIRLHEGLDDFMEHTEVASKGPRIIF